jgi:hypothetical protein
MRTISILLSAQRIHLAFINLTLITKRASIARENNRAFKTLFADTCYAKKVIINNNIF